MMIGAQPLAAQKRNSVASYKALAMLSCLNPFFGFRTEARGFSLYRKSVRSG
jgi:hypothetical protein